MRFNAYDKEEHEATLRGLADDQLNGRIYSNEYLIWCVQEIDQLRKALAEKNEKLRKANEKGKAAKAAAEAGIPVTISIEGKLYSLTPVDSL